MPLSALFNCFLLGEYGSFTFNFEVKSHNLAIRFVNLGFHLHYRNTKWKFLDGVKNLGAPPPRSVIVQQCIRDMQVLEALCDYVSSCKYFFP